MNHRHGPPPHPGNALAPKRIDAQALPLKKGSSYPAPFDAACAARVRQQLGDAAGLTDFGVNLLRLPPGCWSSQRHWHSAAERGGGVMEEKNVKPAP